MARNMPKGVHVAPLFQRLVAWLIDLSVPALLGVLTWFLQPRIVNPSVLLVVSLGIGLLQLAWGLLLWWGYGTRGAGVGFAVMKLQLVGITDGRPIGWWRYFLRQLVFGALVMTIVGGVFLVIFLIIHPRHQGWHDLAGKSVAIRAREKSAGSRPTRTVTGPRKAPSTTVALPPHLVAKAFDGTNAQAPTSAPDPAEVARQAAAYGGQQPAQGAPQSSGWRPPSAPGAGGSAPEPPTGRNAPAGQQPPMGQQLPQQAPAWGGPQPQQGHQQPLAQPYPQPGAPLGYQQSPGQQQPPTQQPAAPQWQRPATPVPDAGETQVRARRGTTDDEEGGTHLVARPASRAGNEGWYIVLDDGRQVDVLGLVVLGRKPTQPVGKPDATLVPAGEGGHAVSKNHLQVGVDARGIWVSDTGSTNGTAVVSVRGDLEPCQPGVQVRVREGQVVSFGDRSLTVRRKPAF
ncbi:RDD family protein [Propionibacteriaceae bacterium Y1923]|uniref:RDD family protein n=1 Tax=Aestuariimicrobium sp. Y1814 TaxID=3418742 RepID=UPI003C1B5DCD